MRVPLCFFSSNFYSHLLYYNFPMSSKKQIGFKLYRHRRRQVKQIGIFSSLINAQLYLASLKRQAKIEKKETVKNLIRCDWNSRTSLYFIMINLHLIDIDPTRVSSKFVWGIRIKRQRSVRLRNGRCKNNIYDESNVLNSNNFLLLIMNFLFVLSC